MSGWARTCRAPGRKAAGGETLLCTGRQLAVPLLSRRPGTGPVTDLAPYESEVATALERGFPWMYFPAPLEQLFERETGHARSRHLVGVGILWIVLGEIGRAHV